MADVLTGSQLGIQRTCSGNDPDNSVSTPQWWSHPLTGRQGSPWPTGRQGWLSRTGTPGRTCCRARKGYVAACL